MFILLNRMVSLALWMKSFDSDDQDLKASRTVTNNSVSLRRGQVLSKDSKVLTKGVGYGVCLRTCKM